MILKILLVVIAVNVATTYAADYEFIDDKCGDVLTLSPNETIVLGVLNFNTPSSCNLQIRTQYGQRIMFYFSDFSITYPGWLKLYDGSSSLSPYVSGLYGQQTGYSRSSVYKTSSNSLFLQMKSGYSPDFTMVLTSYHTGSCYSNEYECSNGRCISDRVTCLGYNTCGDHSDCSIGLSVGGIAGIAIGCFFFVIFLSVAIALLRRRRYAPTVVAQSPYPTYPPAYQSQPQQASPYGVQTPYPTGQQLPTY